MPSIKSELYVIPAGSRILVTSANGFIGSQVVKQMLSLGYFVKGTVRSEKPWLNELFSSEFGADKFELIVISDLSDLEALSKAIDNVSSVVHVASDVSFNPNFEEVIQKVVSATEAFLEAAARQPKGSIKRVVLTSSASAAALPQPGVEGIVITEDTWNEATVKAAYDKSTPSEAKPFTVYFASKTEGERAAWKWVEKNKPSFVFNAVLPYYTITWRSASPRDCWFYHEMGCEPVNLLNGDVTAFGFPGQYFDVGDLARLHVAGLLHPEVKSERLFAFASTFTWNEFVRFCESCILERQTFPRPQTTRFGS